MRQQSYDRLKDLYKNYCGYVKTRNLLEAGFTNRQIAQLMDEGFLEKISGGIFWMPRCGEIKPADYKAVEVGLVNSEAVVIADSACFYQGLITVEPQRLSIATRRSDRHQMKLPFPVARHYLSEEKYEDGRRTAVTKFGSYSIYDIGRSVCDCILFRESIDKEIFSLIIEQYRKEEIDRQTRQRLSNYAKQMRISKEANDLLKQDIVC